MWIRLQGVVGYSHRCSGAGEFHWNSPAPAPLHLWEYSFQCQHPILGHQTYYLETTLFLIFLGEIDEVHLRPSSYNGYKSTSPSTLFGHPCLISCLTHDRLISSVVVESLDPCPTMKGSWVHMHSPTPSQVFTEPNTHSHLKAHTWKAYDTYKY